VDQKTLQWRGYVMILGAAVCWGTMAVVAKLLFRDRGVDPLTLVVVRADLTALILLGVLVVLRRRDLRIGVRDLGFAALVGLGGLMTNNYLYFLTLSLTGVATALLLQYQAPVLVALYTVFVLRQRLPLRLVAALASALVGCALVVRAYDVESLRPNLPGVFAGLGTAVAFAFYILASRAALQRMTAGTLLTYAYLSAALAWSAAAPPWQLLARGFPVDLWGAFLAIAVFGTVIPFGLFIGGLRFLPAAQASIVSMLEPVVAAATAFLVLGESLGPPQILGGALVLAGVMLVETA
jgi:drug/metabolite transporter (DMT)-like permease